MWQNLQLCIFRPVLQTSRFLNFFILLKLIERGWCHGITVSMDACCCVSSMDMVPGDLRLLNLLGAWFWGTVGHRWNARASSLALLFAEVFSSVL